MSVTVLILLAKCAQPICLTDPGNATSGHQQLVAKEKTKTITMYHKDVIHFRVILVLTSRFVVRDLLQNFRVP